MATQCALQWQRDARSCDARCDVRCDARCNAYNAAMHNLQWRRNVRALRCAQRRNAQLAMRTWARAVMLWLWL
jgi:hypothetical protein